MICISSWQLLRAIRGHIIHNYSFNVYEVEILAMCILYHIHVQTLRRQNNIKGSSTQVTKLDSSLQAIGSYSVNVWSRGARAYRLLKESISPWYDDLLGEWHHIAVVLALQVGPRSIGQPRLLSTALQRSATEQALCTQPWWPIPWGTWCALFRKQTPLWWRERVP